MFIELVDSLRCVESHEDTWLVATVFQMDGRHIVEGVLGCPACRREYPVRNGIAWFVDSSETDAARIATPGAVANPGLTARAAALLGLSDAGGIVVLGGHWVACADALGELGPAHIVLVDAKPSVDSTQETSGLVVGERLPFAPGTLRGVALGGASARTGRVTSAAELLRPRGRLVAPATAPLPEGVTELARDVDDWVAERGATSSPPVPLRLSRR